MTKPAVKQSIMISKSIERRDICFIQAHTLSDFMTVYFFGGSELVFPAALKKASIAKLATMLEPPLLINGKVTPVSGSKSVDPKIFKAA